MSQFVWGMILGFIAGIFATSFVAVVIMCMPDKRKKK